MISSILNNARGSNGPLNVFLTLLSQPVQGFHCCRVRNLRYAPLVFRVLLLLVIGWRLNQAPPPLEYSVPVGSSQIRKCSSWESGRRDSVHQIVSTRFLFCQCCSVNIPV